MSDMSYGKGLQTANQQTLTILKHIKGRSAAYAFKGPGLLSGKHILQIPSQIEVAPQRTQKL